MSGNPATAGTAGCGRHLAPRQRPTAAVVAAAAETAGRRAVCIAPHAAIGQVRRALRAAIRHRGACAAVCLGRARACLVRRLRAADRARVMTCLTRAGAGSCRSPAGRDGLIGVRVRLRLGEYPERVQDGAVPGAAAARPPCLRSVQACSRTQLACGPCSTFICLMLLLTLCCIADGSQS